MAVKENTNVFRSTRHKGRASPVYQYDGLEAMRQGAGFIGTIYGHKVAEAATAELITDTSLVMPIGEGERVAIAHTMIGLSSFSDDIAVQFGYVNDTGGGFIPVLPKIHYGSGAANSGTMDNHMDIVPAEMVPYIAGTSVALTAQITANDTSALIDIGMRGWVESDTGTFN